jgi:hypothetical protein
MHKQESKRGVDARGLLQGHVHTASAAPSLRGYRLLAEKLAKLSWVLRKEGLWNVRRYSKFSTGTF